MENLNNSAELCGVMGGAPRFSHTSRGADYFTFPLTARRLSGAGDTVNVILPERLLGEIRPAEGGRVRVLGEVRSFNNRSGVGSRLVISVFARALLPGEGEDLNRVVLRGTLCKPPN
ncbi:MAG: single-stranded DNA-binding protein, partial [Oscillospiraceae bacterium]|nr:single-stranded DNA-binding protein [Oscillospiraceae bacterium]